MASSKLTVVEQLEDELNAALKPEEMSWAVHVVDGDGGHFSKAHRQVRDGWVAARFAEGEYVEALPVGGLAERGHGRSRVCRGCLLNRSTPRRGKMRYSTPPRLAGSGRVQVD